MAPETLPALRCESRLRRSEPRWGLIAAAVVLLASTVDALWLVPAQQRAAEQEERFGPRFRCVDTVPATAAPVRSPTADLRVDRVYLLSAPTP